MQKIVKGTLLNYTPEKIAAEQTVNSARIYNFNDNKIQKGEIIYLMEREIRPVDNFALQFCIEMSKKLKLEYRIINHKNNFEYKPKEDFIKRETVFVKKIFEENCINFEIFEGSDNELLKFLETIPIALLVIDFNPIKNREYLKNLPFKIYEIDSHNIIPSRFLSDKQEYSAATIRRKIYLNIYPFITEYNNTFKAKLPAHYILKDFIKNKLPFYEKYRNDPLKNINSGLSKYLNLGFISSQRVALEIIKADVSRENKEAFLEELIIRKELAENFCLYCKNFKNLECIPNWAKQTLKEHQNDLRESIYTKEQFDNGKTKDVLWNAAQNQLKKEGIIHAYIRMYWAKQIIKWVVDPQSAIDIAIYLNDKYAYDSPGPNGYVGILWSIGAVHDRAFPNRFVTGKIRTMTFNSISQKFNINQYIEKFNL